VLVHLLTIKHVNSMRQYQYKLTFGTYRYVMQKEYM